MTTHSHNIITDPTLQSSLLTNFLPEEPQRQLGDLTNAPYMILLSSIVVAISQTYTLLTHTL